MRLRTDCTGATSFLLSARAMRFMQLAQLGASPRHCRRRERWHCCNGCGDGCYTLFKSCRGSKLENVFL